MAKKILCNHCGLKAVKTGGELCAECISDMETQFRNSVAIAKGEKDAEEVTAPVPLAKPE